MQQAKEVYSEIYSKVLTAPDVAPNKNKKNKFRTISRCEKNHALPEVLKYSLILFFLLILSH